MENLDELSHEELVNRLTSAVAREIMEELDKVILCEPWKVPFFFEDRRPRVLIKKRFG